MTPTALSITKMLADRHAKDLFVPECKDGPTWFGSHMRMDAWAMKRSWTRSSTYGYEIKVSRSDFMRDTKWRGYLECCSQFYFVAPKGLIDPSELPAEAGLLVIAGSRLVTKKHAPHRDVEVPDSLYRYILMSRVEIKGEGLDAESRREKQIEYWQKFLAQKNLGKQLGYELKYRGARRLSELEKRNGQLVRRLRLYAKIRSRLQREGIDPESESEWEVEDKFAKLFEVAPGFERQLKEARDVIDRVRATIARERDQQPGLKA